MSKPATRIYVGTIPGTPGLDVRSEPPSNWFANMTGGCRIFRVDVDEQGALALTELRLEQVSTPPPKIEVYAIRCGEENLGTIDVLCKTEPEAPKVERHLKLVE